MPGIASWHDSRRRHVTATGRGGAGGLRQAVKKLAPTRVQRWAKFWRTSGLRLGYAARTRVETTACGRNASPPPAVISPSPSGAVSTHRCAQGASLAAASIQGSALRHGVAHPAGCPALSAAMARYYSPWLAELRPRPLRHNRSKDDGACPGAPTTPPHFRHCPHRTAIPTGACRATSRGCATSKLRVARSR